jgi:hypothetical protein
MKKTIVLITFILVTLNYLSVRAQPKQVASVSERFSQFNHIEDDSLLFDGEFGFKHVKINSEGCPVEVKYASGKNSGVKSVGKIVTDCSGKVIDTVYTKEKGELKKGDILAPGEEVSTGDDGIMELAITGLGFIRMSNVTKINIPNEFCESKNIYQSAGTLFFKILKGVGINAKIQVSTDKTVSCVKGTEFTVKTGGDFDVVKVYDGTVEVKLVGTSNVKNMDDVAKQMDIVEKEFKDGKITQDEYMKKLQENLTLMQGQSTDMNKSVMVEAGYMITAKDKISTPEPISSGDNKWFEDANFYKK